MCGTFKNAKKNIVSRNFPEFTFRFNALKNLLIVLFFVFSFTLEVSAAEILQVKDEALLQVGDQNRNYTVQIACVDIDQEMKLQARNWLKLKLPRRRRVNLLPLSTENGILVARVIPFGDKEQLGIQMVDKGFGKSTCEG